jgi:hypothetical protein
MRSTFSIRNAHCKDITTHTQEARMNYPTIPALFAAALGLGAMASASAELPASISATGETAVATFHAEGAQIYECKIADDGKLTWQFREPVATLLLDGKTVGRHYAGPNWMHMDGSTVTAKPIGNAPGQTQADIPWLKLEVIGHRGTGAFSSVTTVQRINTRGGVITGACEQVGSYRSAPYAADYMFLRKGSD